MQFIDLATIQSETWKDPKALLIYSTQKLDSRCIAEIRERHPEIIIFGCSSYRGVFSPMGYLHGAYGFLFEACDRLNICVNLLKFDDEPDIRAATAKAVASWCDSSPEKIEFIIHSTAGIEEFVLDGIHDACGKDVHIFGGSAGNDKYLDKPFVFLNNDITNNGVLIIQLLTHSIECSIAMGGYLPTVHSGIITKASGRSIYEIDDKPAMDVYDEWTEGIFAPYIRRGGILPLTSGLYPLGHKLDSEPDCGFWLTHPYAVDRAQGTLKLFATIPEHTRVTLMRGSERMLVTRMGVVIDETFKLVDRSKVVAGLFNYCGGCANVVAESMERVCEQARIAFGDIPFVGLSSLGEQGRLENAQHNYHGNMMLQVFLILKD